MNLDLAIAQIVAGTNSIRALMPAESDVENGATGVTGGLYVQESYKPFPNLSIGVGLRFDRERIDSFGFVPFDPAAERASYDRLAVLAGAEKGKDDFQQGNDDGLNNMGILGDPIFFGGGRSVDLVAQVFNMFRRERNQR